MKPESNLPATLPPLLQAKVNLSNPKEAAEFKTAQDALFEVLNQARQNGETIGIKEMVIRSMQLLRKQNQQPQNQALTNGTKPNIKP
jgi:hypothetical protein